MSPLVEAGKALVPGAELGSFLAASEGTAPQVIFSIEFVGIIIVHSVCEQIIPGSLIVDLEKNSIFFSRIFPVTPGASNKK